MGEGGGRTEGNYRGITYGIEKEMTWEYTNILYRSEHEVKKNSEDTVGI